MTWHLQNEYDVRFEWGLSGASNLASSVDVTIVVDILSFSTCVEIAVAAGAEVYPYEFKNESAQLYAGSLNAICARTIRSKSEICLSPSTLKALQPGDRVVLPSPNGSTISFVLDNTTVLCGCLRNASAVARAASQLGQSVLVIAAGEQWADGSLRPSLEDMIGAGAILSKLAGTISPEALAAIQVFRCFQNDLLSALTRSSSGKELIERGFPEDNEHAAQLDVSDVVPILRNKAYVQLSFDA